MNITSVYKRLLSEFAKPNFITRRTLRSRTLQYNQPFKIWGTTIEGDTYSGREMFSFAGPSRSPGVPYNYNAFGYMIFYDMNKGAYRTFVYDLITAFEQDGVKYDII